MYSAVNYGNDEKMAQKWSDDDNGWLDESVSQQIEPSGPSVYFVDFFLLLPAWHSVDLVPIPNLSDPIVTDW